MEQFTATTVSGEIGGWVTGDGPPVLVLHGGPGLGYEYMDDVVAEVAARYRVATFQQRGLEPSSLEGEFTIAEAVSDIVFLLQVEGDWAVKLVGRYHDVLHHADGTWRFHRREARWADAG